VGSESLTVKLGAANQKHLPKCFEPRREKWAKSEIDPRDRYGWDYFDYDACPDADIFPCKEGQLAELVAKELKAVPEENIGSKIVSVPEENAGSDEKKKNEFPDIISVPEENIGSEISKYNVGHGYRMRLEQLRKARKQQINEPHTVSVPEEDIVAEENIGSEISKYRYNVDGYRSAKEYLRKARKKNKMKKKEILHVEPIFDWRNAGPPLLTIPPSTTVVSSSITPLIIVN
jgi:hypothetical protein